MHFSLHLDLGGIQAIIAHLSPVISERIEPALRDMNDELNALNSEMTMKKEESQTTVGPIPTPESNIQSLLYA